MTDIGICVEENLKAMRASREAFVQAESAEQIKRALRHNVPSYNDLQIQTNDKVYYKRNDKRWCGPASVIGREGKTIILKHGSDIVRAHISRITIVGGLKKQPLPETTGNASYEHVKNIDIDDSDDDSSSDTESNPHQQSEQQIIDESSNEMGPEEYTVDESIGNEKEKEDTDKKIQCPTINSEIMYKDSNGEWKKCIVHSRSGKVGKGGKGKYKYILKRSEH